MIHLQNTLSGYYFHSTKRPNIYSPNVRVVKIATAEYCQVCEEYYKKYKELF